MPSTNVTFVIVAALVAAFYTALGLPIWLIVAGAIAIGLAGGLLRGVFILK